MIRPIFLVAFVFTLFSGSYWAKAQSLTTPVVPNCGVRSVLNLANYLGQVPSNKQTSQLCETYPQSSISMYSVQQAACQLGIPLQGEKVTLDELEKSQQPFIAVLPDHFVFVERVDGPWVLYIESNGLEIRSRASFAQDYRGIALVLADDAKNILHISSAVVDWGKIPAGTVEKKVIVTLTNTGNKPVDIKNITTSCSCTVTSQWPAQIASGQKVPLTITVQLPDSGEFSKAVTIFSNAIYPSQFIWLRGEVESDLQFAPAQLNFGDVAEGHIAMKTLAFQDKYHKMPRPFKVSTSSPDFTAELKPQADDSWNVAVTLNAPAKPSSVATELLISGIKPGSRIVHIPVTATIVPMTRSRPEQAIFGSVDGVTATRILQIFRQDNQPFEITGIKSPNYLHSDFKPINSQHTEWQVSLKLTSAQAPDHVQTQLTISTKCKNMLSSLSVPVLAIVR